jgi:hypothetical protein
VLRARSEGHSTSYRGEFNHPIGVRRPTGRQSAPSNLIGANGFAVEDQSQGRRGLCAVADATGGSALDCDLCTAKESSAPLDGSPALIG